MNSKKYTALGFATLLIWGTSPAFTKILSAHLGGFTAAACVNIIGGILVLIKQKFFDGNLPKFRDASRSYWFICGGLFVIYTASSYIAMALVHNTKTVVTLVLIRFLWPLFTLIFTIPILKQKASPWISAGIMFSLAGIVVAELGSNMKNLNGVFQTFHEEFWPFILCFVVAVSWALYTNYTKKFLIKKDFDGVGIFMLLSGILLGLISLGVQEPRQFSTEILWPLFYQSVVVSFLANILWNKSIVKGNLLVVVLASNFLPIISTVSSGLMLGIPINIYIIIGSLFVVIGTFWSKRCFQHTAEGNP